MKKPNIPKNERDRLNELYAYDVINAGESDDFDFLTTMAAQICDTKISLISLVTSDKQCFLSRHGLTVRETSKDISFCAHAINTPEKPFVVEDARSDDRFFNNPLTTGYPQVIFYVGVPLVNSNGFPLGTLCVIDDKPNKLSDSQLMKLEKLARQTVKLLELRRSQIDLKQANENLEQFAYIAAHDLKEPLRGITTYLSFLKKKYGDELDEKAHSYIDSASKSAERMRKLIIDILDFSKTGQLNQDEIDLNKLVEAIFLNYRQDGIKNSFQLSKSKLPMLIGDETSFIQLFFNLIDNGIKYQPEGNPVKIKIDVKEDETNWIFSVADNGIGIAPEHQNKVFEVFKRLHSQSEYGGTGIGLANCKKIVAAYGGKIWLKSSLGGGSIFYFTIPK